MPFVDHRNTRVDVDTMILHRFEPNFCDMRVMLVVHVELGAEASFPTIVGHVVEHTTYTANVVGVCDSRNIDVIFAFSSSDTPALFQELCTLRPSLGRVVIVPNDAAVSVLRTVNACLGHYALLGTAAEPPPATAVLEALGALEERLPRGATAPRSLSARSLSAQSLARRRQLALLSDREREILLHLAKGARIATISESLHLSMHTVRNHIKAMFRKLDVHSQAELVALARTRSLRPHA